MTRTLNARVRMCQKNTKRQLAASSRLAFRPMMRFHHSSLLLLWSSLLLVRTLLVLSAAFTVPQRRLRVQRPRLRVKRPRFVLPAPKIPAKNLARSTMMSAPQALFATTADAMASSLYRDHLELREDSKANGHKLTTSSDVIGHRGSIYEHVENTLESFARCAELQCSVELDVYETADGMLVVFHGSGSDANPGLLFPQIADTTGSILNAQYPDLAKLQFNETFEEYVCPKEWIAKAKIPLLKDVLNVLQPHMNTQIKVELKAGGSQLVHKCIALIEEFELRDRITFSSFNHSLLKEVHALRPDYRTGALFDEPVPEDFVQRSSNCTEVHLRYDTCSVSRIAEATAAGLITAAWFRGPVAMEHDLTHRWKRTKEEDLYEDLLYTGVRQICCNKPMVLLSMLQATSETCAQQ